MMNEFCTDVFPSSFAKERVIKQFLILKQGSNKESELSPNKQEVSIIGIKRIVGINLDI